MILKQAQFNLTRLLELIVAMMNICFLLMCVLLCFTQVWIFNQLWKVVQTWNSSAALPQTDRIFESFMEQARDQLCNAMLTIMFKDFKWYLVRHQTPDEGWAKNFVKVTFIAVNRKAWGCLFDFVCLFWYLFYWYGKLSLDGLIYLVFLFCFGKLGSLCLKNCGTKQQI